VEHRATDPSKDALDIQGLRQSLGASYERFNSADRAAHLRLLQSLRRPEDVALDIQPIGDERYTLTVCATDCAGALSVIAGLLTACRFRILKADIFTVHRPAPPPAPIRHRAGDELHRRRPPAPRPPGRVLLDIFEVDATEVADPEVWTEFQQQLSQLMALLVVGNRDSAREYVIDRVSRVGGLLEESAQLFPLSIQVSNDASPEHTQLVIRSTDTVGFLFAFTNALTALNVNIDHAEIRTIGSEVRDTFWLTDFRDRKITSPELLEDLRVAIVLIKHFTYLLPRAANPAQALRQFNSLTSQMLSRPDWTRELRDLESAQVLETLAQMMGISQFLWDDFLRMQHENLFPVLVDVPALAERRSTEMLRALLRQQLQGLPDLAARVRQLNRLKDKEMFRIDLRHITGRIGFRVFSEELSDLAEAVVEGAAAIAFDDVAQRHGTPRLAEGVTCPWALCALGKFGGREMGFGSDIELLFVYAAEGTTEGPAAIENSRFFSEAVHVFRDVITAPREGIFEIDLRLRPYGNKGPLASTLAAFRAYYVEGAGAQQFERLAFVKLRCVAGDPSFATKVMQARDAFVYSGKPVDVENILHLRRRQALELVATGAVNAKYSPGGLVDVEYFTQACQITVGHADSAVRVTNTLEAIDRLSQAGHVASDLADQMRTVYGFLRRLIDALRAVRGHAKDLTIPPTDSQEFAYLARRLDYASTADLQTAIAEQMSVANRLWTQPLPTSNQPL